MAEQVCYLHFSCADHNLLSGSYSDFALTTPTLFPTRATPIKIDSIVSDAQVGPLTMKRVILKVFCLGITIQ